jgi:acetyl/propionyl-CoA carboxylase alpha subunit
MAAAMWMHAQQQEGRPLDLWASLAGERRQLSPAGDLGVYSVWAQSELIDVSWMGGPPSDQVSLGVGGERYELRSPHLSQGRLSAWLDDRCLLAMQCGDHIEASWGGVRGQAQAYAARQRQDLHGGGQAIAPMHGVVVAVDVAEGQVVKVGDRLAVVEAMKMENPVLAAVGGVVEQVMCVCGQQVANQQVLVVIKEESS